MKIGENSFFWDEQGISEIKPRLDDFYYAITP
jgi:hypothetical protein